MDWLKDITVEEFAEMFKYSFQIEHGAPLVVNPFHFEALKTANFKKCYNEKYGTYFQYDVRISVPCVCDHETESVVCKETRHIGQFGLLHRVDGMFTDFAVIGEFPEIQLVTPLHTDSFDLRKSYGLYENGGFYYNHEKDFLIGSYIEDAGKRMFQFVAKKNKGVLDEYGRTYQEAYTAKQEQCVQDYITEHCNTIINSINMGLRKDGLAGIMNPNKKFTKPSESGEDE